MNAIVEDTGRILGIDLEAQDVVGWLDGINTLPDDAEPADIKVAWDQTNQFLAIGTDKTSAIFDLSIFYRTGVELCRMLAQQAERLGPVVPADSEIALLTGRLGSNLFEELGLALEGGPQPHAHRSLS